MKTTALMTLATIVLTSGAAFAAPAKHFDHRGHDGRGISAHERVMIARSTDRLQALKRRAWADGRITFFERLRINAATRQHAALVARARRS